MTSEAEALATSAQPPAAAQKEVIVLVPRFAVDLPNDARDGLLVPGLLSQGACLSLADSPTDFRRVAYGSRKLDICEVFWRDLTDELGKDSAGKQILRSLGLFDYWRRIKFKTLKSEKSLAKMLLITLVSLGLWYVSTLYAAYNLLPKDVRTPVEASVTKLWKLATHGALFGHVTIPHWLNTLGSLLESSVAWAILSLVLVKLGIPTLVNTSDFVRRYLTNLNLPEEQEYERSPHAVPTAGPLDASTQPLVLRIQLRLLEKLFDLHKKGYTHITILAHSMGCLLSVRLFADSALLALLPRLRIRLVTMGGTLQFLNMREDRVHKMALQCYKNLGNLNSLEGVSEQSIVWYDYFSETDWYSSNSPILKHDEHPRFFGQELTELPKEWNQQTSGVTHSAYFADPIVLQMLLKMWD